MMTMTMICKQQKEQEKRTCEKCALCVQIMNRSMGVGIPVKTG